ncbi:MAG TPA: hypothetical protein PLJ69_07545 [Methanothrix sp.]|jgi:hypothetical protein|nr:hypothetical protein [Methanothrix sp.]
MKAGVLILLSFLSVLLSPPSALAGCGDGECEDADWKIAKNVTQRSTIFLIGYMDEMGAYQTESGIAGSKLVYGVRGSGTASKTMTVYVDEGGVCDGEGGGSGIYYNVQAEYNYHPYTFIPQTTTYDKKADSYLRSALRAKNRVVGTAIAENSPGVEYLIKEDATDEESLPPAMEVLRLGSW